MFKRKKNNFSKGLTLTETLVYVAVLAILISAVASFFVWALHSSTKNKAMREVFDAARRTIEIISSEIKEAESIYESTSVFGSHPGQLSLEVVKHLPEGENKSYLDFYLCQDRLCLKKESQNPIALTSDEVKITNLVFSRIGADSPSIKIDLKIEFDDDTGRKEKQASIEISSVASQRRY